MIAADCKIVEPKVKLKIINEDEEDNKIIECALAARADLSLQEKERSWTWQV